MYFRHFTVPILHVINDDSEPKQTYGHSQTVELRWPLVLCCPTWLNVVTILQFTMYMYKHSSRYMAPIWLQYIFCWQTASTIETLNCLISNNYITAKAVEMETWPIESSGYEQKTISAKTPWKQSLLRPCFHSLIMLQNLIPIDLGSFCVYQEKQQMTRNCFIHI